LRNDRECSPCIAREPARSIIDREREFRIADDWAENSAAFARASRAERDNRSIGLDFSRYFDPACTFLSVGSSDIEYLFFRFLFFVIRCGDNF